MRTDEPSINGGGMSAYYSFLPTASEVCFAILDVQERRMLFFIRDDFGNEHTPANPTRPDVVRRHVLRAFHQFYWLAPQDLLY